MEIIQYSAAQYADIFGGPYHVFNTAAFNSLNEKIHNIPVLYLGFKTKKHKLGIIGSLNNNKKFTSPFSAPFGGFTYAQKDISIATIDEAIDTLIAYCTKQSFSEIELTQPPHFYEPGFISKVGNSLYRHGFEMLRSDLNYSIHIIPNSREHYVTTLHYNARKNLNIALQQPFTFRHCTLDSEKKSAYNVIKENRLQRGFPLRLGYEVIEATSAIIKSDFFLVSIGGQDVAAAMVFHVAKDIVQVVYWGDLPQFAANKTMNFLSYNVVSYYFDTGIRVIDIGPSTEDSVPNYGLCDFKESIGCEAYPKTSWKCTL